MIAVLNNGTQVATVTHPADFVNLVTDGPGVTFDPASLQAWADKTINQEHARLLASLTENATPEERDTWVVKDGAARAYGTPDATALQSMIIELEAAGDGITPTDFTQIVEAKSDQYQEVIGRAGALRRKARTAAEQIANAGLPATEATAQVLSVVLDLQTDAQALLNG